MCLVAVSYQIDFLGTSGVDSPWPSHSLNVNHYDYFHWWYLKDCAYHTNLHTVQELQVEIEAAAEESQVTCCLTQLTTMWFIYESMRSKRCSHEDHMQINSP